MLMILAVLIPLSCNLWKKKKIKEHLNAESVFVTDASGDGRHAWQRMVYKAIWEELQNTVHAVDQMTIRTPSEAASQK